MAPPKKTPTASAGMKQAAQQSLQATTTEAKEKSVQQRSSSIREQLEKIRGVIKDSLIKQGVTPDYVIATAMTALRTNPQLMECTTHSVLAGILQSVQLGLRLDGPLGHAYLLPFRNSAKNTMEAQFVPGYRGLIDLAYRNDRVMDVAAGVVRQGDEFSYERGSSQKLVHVPKGGDLNRAKTHAYAYARLQGGGFVFAVLEAEEIERRRAMSRNKDSGAWKLHSEKMWMKTALRDLSAWMPLSVEFSTAVRMDEMVAEGIPQELDISEETGGVIARGGWESLPTMPQDDRTGKVEPTDAELEAKDAAGPVPASTEAVPTGAPEKTTARENMQFVLRQISAARSVAELEPVATAINNGVENGGLSADGFQVVSEAYSKKYADLLGRKTDTAPLFGTQGEVSVEK